jgi:hypothetical protein
MLRCAQPGLLANSDSRDVHYSVRSPLAAAAIWEVAGYSKERESREDELRRLRSRLGKQVDRVFGLIIVTDSIHPHTTYPRRQLSWPHRQRKPTQSWPGAHLESWAFYCAWAGVQLQVHQDVGC